MGGNSASNGGGGNTGRERGAERNRKQSTPSSKFTNTPSGNNREDARSRSQVSTGKPKSTPKKTNTVTRGNGGGDNQVVQAPTTPVKKIIPEVIAPTTAEVSQVKEIDKDVEDPIEVRKRKAKARGRSPTILTGVTGVTGGLTLGKPSLLGR